MREVSYEVKYYLLCLKLLKAYFGNDYESALWMANENPITGYMSPSQIIRMGGGSVVANIIKSRIEANKALVERQINE